MTVYTNKTLKWDVNPQTVCTKRVDDELIHKVLDWVLRNSTTCECPIVRDTLLIEKQGNGD